MDDKTGTTVTVLVAVVTVVTIGTTAAAYSAMNKKRKDNSTTVKEPPVVWSWIPYLGSAIEMGQLGHYWFIQKYTRHFQTPVFSATIMGRFCHFIGDSRHTQFVFNDPKEFDTHSLAKDFLDKAMGCDTDDAFKMANHPEGRKASRDVIRAHVTSNESVEQTVQQAQQILMGLLTVSNYEKELDLYQFVKEKIFLASVEPFVGKDLAQTKFLPIFSDFDHGIPLVMAGAPRFALDKFYRARDVFVAEFLNPNFPENCSPFMKARIESGLKYGTKPDTIARINISIFWATVGNSAPSIFWTILFILRDPQAYAAIQKEVASLSASNNQERQQQGYSLSDLDKCVLIKSAFTETLRLRAWAFTVKALTGDVIFDPKTLSSGNTKYLLKKGTHIMGNQAAMFMDPDIFPNPQTFQYDRFAADPVTGKPPVFSTKNGKTIPDPIKVFGGGKRLCPGRKFVTYETKAFLVILFTKFDMELVTTRNGDELPPLPELDKKMGGVGVMQPVHDVKVKFTAKQIGNVE